MATSPDSDRQDPPTYPPRQWRSGLQLSVSAGVHKDAVVQIGDGPASPNDTCKSLLWRMYYRSMSL